MSKDRENIMNDEKDIISKDIIDKDVILSEAKDLADDEIKDMFDEEFDLAGITVSEELIAKTMTAIRGLSETETVEFSADNDIAGKEATEITRASKITAVSETTKSSVQTTEQSETSTTSDKIVSISKRQKVMKLVSGLAAALFIGVVVFVFLKMGVGGISKSEDRASEPSEGWSTTASQANSIATDSESSYKGASATTDSAEYFSYENHGSPVDLATEENTAPQVTLSGTDNSDEPTLSAGDGISAPEFDGTEKVDNENKDKAKRYLKILNGNAKATSDIKEVKDYIEIESLKVAGSMNMLLAPITSNDPVIRASDIYEEVLEEVDPITEEALYTLLRDSEDDPAREYIYALMLQDVSGIVFEDEKSEKTWTTGKEYLELYEAALKDSKDE